jgi:hypothetical protein
MDIQDVGGGSLEWIELAQDRDKWQALVNVVMNLRDPQNAGNFLNISELVSFSRRTVLHAVSIKFRDMPLVLVDYTIQAVWSFCNNQLTVIMDRTTRTAS